MPDAPTQPTAGARPGDILAMAKQLVALLEDLHECYTRIEELGEKREAAVRSADTATLTECLKTEDGAVERIIRLERRREGIVAFFTEQFGAASDEQTSARFIAERLDDRAMADRIVEAADALRAKIKTVQEKNESSRLAVETLASHMQGLLRTAAERASATGAYGAKGEMARSTQVVSSVDVTS